MLNNDKIKSFNTLQLKYETEKKEAALNQLKLAANTKRINSIEIANESTFYF
jgi:hypothetical protein